MKRFYLTKLMVLAVAMAGISWCAKAQTVTFSYTGAVQTWQVPSGVTSVSVDMMGANGGAGGQGSNTNRGGRGGRVICTLAVTPGEILNIYVGGVGGSFYGSCCSNHAPGGWNGGGQGYYAYDGGGGGATDIRRGGTAVGNRIVVAGAGGGGAYNCGGTDAQRGGDGGGTTGETGFYCSSQNTGYAGSGGTQSNGGAYGSFYFQPSGTGSLGQGGSATQYYYCGGGGGGYYGGGAAGSYGGGGGGSSFPASNGGSITNLAHTQGFNTTTPGNGQVTIIGPTISTSTSSIAFGSLTIGGSATRSFTVSGVNLTGGAITVTAPTSFEVSLDNVTFTSSVSISYTGSVLAARTVYVRFNATSYSFFSADVTAAGGGAPSSANVLVTGTGTPACSGTPTAGTANINVTSGSGSTVFNLGLTGTSVAGGLTYQWQRSAFSSGGFSDISGATGATYSFTGITTPTYYRARVSCGTNSSSSSSVFASPDVAPSSCAPTCAQLSSFCSNAFVVASSSNALRLTGEDGTSINDNAGCSSGVAYRDFATTLGCNMAMGGSYVCTLGSNTVSSYPMSSQVWIDFNNDGSFATTESVGGGNFSSPTYAANLTIPSTGVNPGKYRMRVVVPYASGCSSNYPCFPSIPPCPTTTVQYCETRDYFANITPAPCSGTPTAGTVAFDVNNSCTTFTATMFGSGTTIAPGITYNWQRSTTSSTSGFTNIAGATNSFYVATISTTSWYRLSVTCTNSSQTSVSAAQQFTMNTVPATITSSGLVCTGNPVALSTTPAGGTWTSSNTTIAVAGLTTGVIDGLSPGLANITYTLPSGCTTIKVVTVQPAPSAIIGSSNVCEMATIGLSNTYPGGAWSTSNATIADVDAATGVVTGMSNGTASIAYTLPTGCSISSNVIVNPLPAAIGGATSVCMGGRALMTNASPGGTWSSSNSFLAAVDAATGEVSGVALGGSPMIWYHLPTGCGVSAPVTVNPLPAAITGPTSVCVGSTTTVYNTDLGGTWSSSDASQVSIDAMTGELAGLAAGTSPSIKYTLPTGCSVNTNVSVKLLPAVFTVSGGGNYCPGGTGVHIGLTGSVSGVNYDLYEATTGFAGTAVGSSSGIDFGLFTAVGTYTVVATDPTTTCVQQMAGSVSVNLSALPVVYNVAGGGNYCAGGTGVEITLDGSTSGSLYQLVLGTANVGSPVPGTGSAISLGFRTANGAYTVVGTDGASGCTANMNGSATVTAIAAPTAYTVSGGGAYCSGTGGVHVILDNSDGTVSYELFNGTTSTGTTLTGTGASLDFGAFTASGNYSIVGTDGVTTCTSNMANTVAISVNPLPNVQFVTGGGNYCAGVPDKRIGLAYGQSGIRYRLYNGGLMATEDGSNSGLDFGVQSAAGVYTVVAENIVTGCIENMSGSATIAINALPIAQTVTGGGDYCAGGAGMDVSIGASEASVNYQLYRGTAPVAGGTMVGTGGGLSFGNQTAQGVYTVKALNPTTTCRNDMTGSATVNVNPLPVLYTLSGGGSLCAGTTGVNITLSGSNTGVNYELYNAGTATGIILAGTGTALTFGPVATGGYYTAVATDVATSCTRNMAGSSTVRVNPLPAAYAVTVSDGGAYCTGGTGVRIGLALSNTGINYDLKDGTGNIVGTIAGTGAAIDFGRFTVSGAYTIEATNTISGCVNTMSGAATVTVNTLPTVYTVIGGGTFCAGGTGVAVDLSSSDLGTIYQLYNGTTPIGAAATGTGASVSFGLVAATGTFTATAYDPMTGCSTNMAASAVVNVNPLPVAFNVTGGGDYCSGGTGVHIGLSGSNVSDVMYQVYEGGTTAVGSFWAGTGLALDFGAYTGAGAYTVEATNVTTGCTNMMTGTANVGIIPSVVPAVLIDNTAGGATVCNGTAVTYTANPTNGGSTPSYTWKVNGITRSTSASFSYVPMVGDNVSVMLTSNATCATPATATETMPMTVLPNVTPSATVATPLASVCPGTSVTFTATVLNGGTTPVYSWKKNGAAVGTNTATYATVPNDEDVIFCIVESNEQCRTTSTVLSNNVVMDVNTPVVPTFGLEANTGLNLAAGQNATFTVTLTNVLNIASYQWKVNGTNVAGGTSRILNINTLENGDVVSCVVTNTNVCGSASSTESVMVYVAGVGVADVTNGTADIRVVPNPNNGNFSIKGSLSGIANGTVVVEVANMLGQVVFTANATVSNGTIDQPVQLSNTLANGMYLLNVRSGNETKTFHFVVGQ